MIPRINLTDFISLQSSDLNLSKNKLVNIRGCNGSGKSTIPLLMKENDPCTFEIIWRVNGKERVLATVFPSYGWLALGKYSTACGGMDSMKNTDEIKLAARTVWNLDYNIIMEGIMASTVRQTYIDLFKSLNFDNSFQREVIIYNLTPPLEVCLQRIQKRNGGKPVKEEQVQRKWKIVDGNVKHFADAGFRSIRVINTDTPMDKILDEFFQNLSKNEQNYEWSEYYKEPDKNVQFNQNYLDSFWKFIYERQKIYYKRVVLGQSFPWTTDEVLKTYRFTNICRDLDKLSLYEIKHIIKKLDEPGVDVELRKRSVMFNILLFRTFVKIETYECFGFIDFSDPNWRDFWEAGKQRVLQRREEGKQNFTGSYMVNNLKVCNPDSSTNNNQTLNALCLCESFLDNLEDIYENAVKSSNMKEALQYLNGLTGVGGFNSYEFACSFAMSGRYVSNVLTSWTQDSYTSIGPGSKAGLEYIYTSRGNLTQIEAIIYLRSIWKSEMKRLGIYGEFVGMLPKILHEDLDLRTIEHCLCEYSKYIKLSEKTGRTKRKFTLETSNPEELNLESAV